jgi:hypothetical protein
MSYFTSQNIRRTGLKVAGVCLRDVEPTCSLARATGRVPIMDIDKIIGRPLADQSAVGGDKSAHMLDKSLTSPPERVLYRRSGRGILSICIIEHVVAPARPRIGRLCRVIYSHQLDKEG